jgi:hypothetical protein
MTLNRGMPTDPTVKQNATNLEDIAIAVKNGHWTSTPMFWMTLIGLWMTLVILILTGWMTWMAYTQFKSSQTAPPSIPKLQSAPIP